MPCVVLLTADAAKDLEDILEYVSDRDSPTAAEKVLAGLEAVLDGLGEFPLRGRHSRELAGLGMSDFREVVSGPYRVVYRVGDEVVHVYLIADARRDMQSLLARRLLGP